MQPSNRTAKVFHEYPLTFAYFALCLWVTLLVLILEALS